MNSCCLCVMSSCHVFFHDHYGAEVRSVCLADGVGCVRPGWRLMEGRGWAQWRVKEDINGAAVGRWIALTQQPNEAWESACDEVLCVWTYSSEVWSKGCWSTNLPCHLLLALDVVFLFLNFPSPLSSLAISPPVTASILFLIQLTSLYYSLSSACVRLRFPPNYPCFPIHCSLTHLHSLRPPSLSLLPLFLLQPYESPDLQTRLSEAEESAQETQEELENERPTQKETALKLTQVSLHHRVVEMHKPIWNKPQSHTEISLHIEVDRRIPNEVSGIWQRMVLKFQWHQKEKEGASGGWEFVNICVTAPKTCILKRAHTNSEQALSK